MFSGLLGALRVHAAPRAIHIRVSRDLTETLPDGCHRVMVRYRRDAQEVLENKVKDLLFPHLSSHTTPAMDLNKSIDYSTLKGKTALITGAAGGLGRGMALEWAKNG